jgi:hypothetical protein
MSSIIVAKRVRSEDQRIVSIRPHGDLEVVFTYADGEPLMLLRPRYSKSSKVAFGIMLDAAWKYYDREAGETMHSVYAVAMSVKIAHDLGMKADPRTRYRICEAILESIDELNAMPPFDGEAKVDADVEGTVRIGDETFTIDTQMEAEQPNSTEGLAAVDNPLEQLLHK